MNNELFNRLNSIDEQIGELTYQIEKLEAEIGPEAHVDGMSVTGMYNYSMLDFLSQLSILKHYLIVEHT
ncbi:MAG: hypothetical protein HFH47_03480, partial [Bacilli bacterium]|nr:hypothetical protein [Bacilli bacterium]